jgi:predicted dehydrogenase
LKRFTASVIGLGQIGQGYDYDCSDDTLILTHANGFARHDGYDLLAGVDPDKAQCERFEKRFGRPAYEDVKTLLSHHLPEIVSICVPTHMHRPVFHEVMGAGPRAVLCEKPIATRVDDANDMTAAAEKNHCTLLVNYMRRFEPGVISLRQTLQNKDFGDIYKGVVWYGKGILNNGSHFVDLLRFLLGEVTEIRMIRKGRKWNGSDPEPDLCLAFGGVPVYFLSTRDEHFSLGEMTLIGSSGTIHYGESGSVIKTRKTEPDPVYPGYTALSGNAGSIRTDLNRYQMYVLEHLYHHLTAGVPLNSDGRSAVETLKVIEDITGLCEGE